MSDKILMPVLPILPGISLPQSQKTIPFPSTNNKNAIKSNKKIMPKSYSIRVDESLEVNDTLHSTNNVIENELTQLGYSVINKIVTSKSQLLKAINKKGQKVYIYIDVLGCSSINENEIMITETNINSLSYSIKNGAYNCVGTDVIGVVFEYGINYICTIMRGDNDLKFNETNYVLSHNNHNHTHNNHTHNNHTHNNHDNHNNLSFEGCVITYPMIKLSEVKANPDCVLYNTDIVTRRLRNAEDSYERQELLNTDLALEQLNDALCNFKIVCNNSTNKVIMNIQELKNMEECQDNNEKLRNDLVKSNDNIIKLICIMKKVANKRKEMEKIANEIQELTNCLNSQI